MNAMATLLIEVNRTKPGDDSCGGALLLNGEIFCKTLEDELRKMKVPGETAINPGEYIVKPRTEGKLHTAYRNRYPEHVGMMHLQDVPNFKWIYIHTGNTDGHTDGCILVGEYLKPTGDGNHTIHDSRKAYKRLYAEVAAAWKRGEVVRIRIRNP